MTVVDPYKLLDKVWLSPAKEVHAKVWACLQDNKSISEHWWMFLSMRINSEDIPEIVTHISEQVDSVMKLYKNRPAKGGPDDGYTRKN